MKNLPWVNYLIEFITVVLGILLAFGLNTYYNNRIEEERASHFLEGVRREIEVNANEIAEKLKYHQGIINNLSNSPDTVIIRLKSPNVKSYAWQIAQDNSISQHIPYDVYKKLAEIYAMQQLVDQSAREASGIMAHSNVISPYYIIGVDVNEEQAREFTRTVKMVWIPVFEDFVYYEEKLTELYKEALEMF